MNNCELSRSRVARIARSAVLTALLLTSAVLLHGQGVAPFQDDFPAGEFVARRNQVFDAIGPQAIALIQGAPGVDGFKVFRQSNEFYYLSGLESPHAYLVLDGRTRRTSLYLSHRNEALERSTGTVWSAEDHAEVKRLTGVDDVAPVELLSRQTFNTMLRGPRPVLYVPFSPAEGEAQSRDEVLGHQAGVAADPWDGRPSREAHFLRLLDERYPSLERRNLTPILDALRMIKSPREIALIRQASVLAGLGLLEAMKSTRPGVFEYQVAAAARFTFLANGARFEGYNPIAGGGTNAWMGHYSRNLDRLQAGDMVLVDYAPDLRYYTSDVTRMWPVSGSHTDAQRTLATFILEYRTAFFRHIRPGVTPDEVLVLARRDMEPVLAQTRFAKATHRKAAEEMLTFRGHLQHPVGMTVHDPGVIWGQPFREGMVFTVDPMMWIPDEKLYVRMEDTIVITKDGMENFTASLASTPQEIEAVMKQEGLLARVPRLP
ncbi:MAG: Xaa-Pro peptidase family protein [Acidobacteriota bacterium]|nr:Xaa-Pro peptidase family protein [Acidobacteriota bacterium]